MGEGLQAFFKKRAQKFFKWSFKEDIIITKITQIL